MHADRHRRRAPGRFLGIAVASVLAVLVLLLLMVLDLRTFSLLVVLTAPVLVGVAYLRRRSVRSKATGQVHLDRSTRVRKTTRSWTGHW